MVIEVVTFRLAEGADEAAFLDADRRVQTELIPNHPGFLRRTTARGEGGEWIVVTLWSSERDAKTSMERAEGHPAMADLMASVDASTLQLKRYTTLD